MNSNQTQIQFTADSIGHGFAQGKTLFWNRAMLEAAGGIKTKRPVAIVPFDDVASPYKTTKLGFWRGLDADALMIRDILLTVSLAEIVSQIVTLKRRQWVD